MASLQVAMNGALRSLRPTTNVLARPYVVPIGIYLDISDEEVIRKVKGFWIAALPDEGFDIIAESEVRGSRFIAFFGGIPRSTYRNFQKKVSRLAKQAKSLGKTIEKAATVVI